MAVAVKRYRRVRYLIAFVALFSCFICATQDGWSQKQTDLKELVQSVVLVEQQASIPKPPFLYTSIEKSDRTSGHVWTELVADISQGRLRYLIAVDGQPLSQIQREEEIARIRSIAANPDSFIRREKTRQNDEKHAREMLDLLPRAFSFEDGGKEGPWLRVNYRPNPDYVPESYEERVLHGMTGTLLIDTKSGRLHQLSGRLTDEVKFGYGWLGTIQQGSDFTTTRDMIAPDVWKTTLLDTHLNGRLAIFKTVSRTQHYVHHDFRPLHAGITVPQAAALLIR
jgi:hypothetical protein